MTYESVLLHLCLREDCWTTPAASSITELFRHRLEDLPNLTFSVLRKVHADAAHIETARADGRIEDVHVQTRKIFDMYV